MEKDKSKKVKKTKKNPESGKKVKASLAEIETAVAEAPVTKKSEKKEKGIDKATAKHVGRRIDAESVLYIYPEDATDNATRKKFRGRTRSERKRLEANVKKATKGKLEGVTAEAAQRQLDKFMKTHYNLDKLKVA